MVLFDSVFASVTQRFLQKMCELPDQAECTDWRNSATHFKKITWKGGCEIST